jgi:hypothetical protein
MLAPRRLTRPLTGITLPFAFVKLSRAGIIQVCRTPNTIRDRRKMVSSEEVWATLETRNCPPLVRWKLVLWIQAVLAPGDSSYSETLYCACLFLIGSVLGLRSQMNRHWPEKSGSHRFYCKGFVQRIRWPLKWTQNRGSSSVGWLVFCNQISTLRPAVLIEIFGGFLQSLQTIAGIVP